VICGEKLTLFGWLVTITSSVFSLTNFDLFLQMIIAIEVVKIVPDFYTLLVQSYGARKNRSIRQNN
jgi:hypothetical protein